MKNTNCEAPHTIFSILLFLHYSQFQIFRVSSFHTGPCSESHEFIPCPYTCLFKIHCNIIFPPSRESCKLSLSLMFSNQNFVGIAYPSCLLHNLPITSSLLYYLGEEYNLQSFLLCTLLQPSITCNMLGSIVFFALFSRHFNLCSSHSALIFFGTVILICYCLSWLWYLSFFTFSKNSLGTIDSNWSIWKYNYLLSN